MSGTSAPVTLRECLAPLDEVVNSARGSLRPPPRMTLSEWADANFYLSAESSATPGRWETLPYQRGMMDAITDPRVEKVYVIKSARVGFTKAMNAAIAYYVQHDPSSIMVVQPTVDGAKIYSKEEIAPMFRDVPALREIRERVKDEEEDVGPKGSGNTILHKRFPGGVLSMVGANSGAGFRSVSRRLVFMDEVDAYPASAGSDGDPVKLAIKRAEYFWNRKIVAGSTPLVDGASRIRDLFLEGDQRRYFVPCPECGHMAPLVWNDETGHRMRWSEADGRDAFFECQKHGCVIEHRHKGDMLKRGEWRAAGEFRGTASFHVWTAYSLSPNASWRQLVAEFLEAKKKPETLRTFVNTVLGETWTEQGDSPDWERLAERRTTYERGAVPQDALFLTCGVDVQKDRFYWEVVAWGRNLQSWSVDCGFIRADTANAADWVKLDEELLAQSWGGATIRMLAVDSGFNTQMAYNWTRARRGRTMAVKGRDKNRDLIALPSKTDVQTNGNRVARGAEVTIVGTDVAKRELYGWLNLPMPAEGEHYPAGFCHFPSGYEQEYFKQLTAEQLETTVDKRTRFQKREWKLKAGRENHWLDCRVYARAAASRCGLDRLARKAGSAPAAAPAVPKPAAPVKQETQETPKASQQAAPKKPRSQISDSKSWIGRGKGNWLGRRR